MIDWNHEYAKTKLELCRFSPAMIPGDFSKSFYPAICLVRAKNDPKHAAIYEHYRLKLTLIERGIDNEE